MSKIAISGASTGTATFTIESPATSTNRTLTLPDNTGTIITTGSTFAGTGPAFSAYNTGSQSISSATATKVVLQNENFDTASCFDNVTNYRFTPNVAGYYQINGSVYINSTGTTAATVAIIYKNGSAYQGGSFQNTSTPENNAAGLVSSVVYFNGTTDYVELYAYAVTTGTATIQDAGVIGLKAEFSGFLARAA
jgi:hypothetical protein